MGEEVWGPIEIGNRCVKRRVPARKILYRRVPSCPELRGPVVGPSTRRVDLLSGALREQHMKERRYMSTTMGRVILLHTSD